MQEDASFWIAIEERFGFHVGDRIDKSKGCFEAVFGETAQYPLRLRLLRLEILLLCEA